MSRKDGATAIAPFLSRCLTLSKSIAPALLGNSLCLLCECQTETDSVLCARCKTELPWLRNCCQRCALPLPQTVDLCGDCVQKPPSFDSCTCAFVYRNPIRSLIHQFKQRRQMLPGKVLSTLLTEKLLSGLPKDARPDAITSIPLHWRRQCLRGFNQSHFLALELSNALEIPFAVLCKRRLATPKQQRLTRKQRLQNLRAAFVSCSENIKGLHVVIVDDVVTTQATVESMSSVLKRAGAARVDVWAVARTPAI